MAYHNTKTGSIELVAKWGHGGPAPSIDERFALGRIEVHDNDGHHELWAFTGDARDAALKLAELTTKSNEYRLTFDTHLLTFDGRCIEWVARDLWADGVEVAVFDGDGEPIEWHYHPEKHPNGLCMV